MFKRNYIVLFLNLFALNNVNYLQGQDFERSEILSSGNPLVIAMYAARLKFDHRGWEEQKPVNFARCLARHPLSSNPWLAEKGFLRDLVDAKKNNLQPESVIVENERNYQEMSDIAQRLILKNLMDAFHDCISH